MYGSSGRPVQTSTSCAGRTTGNGRKGTASTTVKMVALKPPREQLPEPGGQLAERSHSVPAAQFSTPFTPFTVRSHAARSRSSWSRPASVSE